MFGRKRPPAPPPGRQKRPMLPDRNAAVFSYHASRAVRPADSARGEAVGLAAAVARKRTRLKWLKRGPSLAAFLIVAALLLSNLIVASSPHVVPLRGTRGQIFLRNQAAYQAAARAELTSSILNKNKITIDTTKIATDLSKQFPELAHVSVTLPLIGRAPTVYLYPRTPALLLATPAGSLHVIDDTGRVLLPASQALHVTALHLPTVTDQSGLKIEPGKSALPSDSVTFITEVVGQLEAKKLKITTMTLPPAASELDVRLDGAPYTVKFNLRGDGRAEAGTYLAVKQQLEKDGKTPGQYVDVRVDKRAYYK